MHQKLQYRKFPGNMQLHVGNRIGHVQHLCHFYYVRKFMCLQLIALPHVDNLNRAVVGRSRLTTTVRGSLLFTIHFFLSACAKYSLIKNFLIFCKYIFPFDTLAQPCRQKIQLSARSNKSMLA
jgi:hypothetical protein